MSSSYDLIVLGGGGTGIAAALRAAGYGARTLLIEASRPGGACVNWGCVPSKTLIDLASRYHARFPDQMPPPLPDLATWRAQIAAMRQASLEVFKRQVEAPLLAEDRITLLRGKGRFIAPNEIVVAGEHYRAEKILIACGGAPRRLTLPGDGQIRPLTAYTALGLRRCPASLLILGGGVIALEMGQLFARFGSKVTILERGSHFLPDFDPRLSTQLRLALEAEGVDFHFGVQTERIKRERGGVALHALKGGEKQIFHGDELLTAVGTAPAITDLNLSATDIATDRGGFISVDATLRTSADGIWAAGDIIGAPLIAPAGVYEAEVAVDNMFGQSQRSVDHRCTPLSLFVEPELASVGICAQQAAEEKESLLESYVDLADIAKSHIVGNPPGGMVLWADTNGGRLRGVQIFAPRAADIINEAVLALRHNLTVHDLAACSHTYPTIAVGLHLAARRLVRTERTKGAPASFST